MLKTSQLKCSRAEEAIMIPLCTRSARCMVENNIPMEAHTLPAPHPYFFGHRYFLDALKRHVFKKKKTVREREYKLSVTVMPFGLMNSSPAPCVKPPTRFNLDLSFRSRNGCESG